MSEMTSHGLDGVPETVADGAERAPDWVTPPFWAEACRHLSRRDRVMRKLIDEIGQAHLHSQRDAFTTLARSIVGQQASSRSAQSVWAKLLASLKLDAGNVRVVIPADTLAAMPGADLRAVGLSARKVEYLSDLAHHFAQGRVHVDQWSAMSDDAIVDELTAIRGIGRWTADMFLIFHQMRANVLPLDDPGLSKAMSLNYFSGEPVSRAEAREIAEAWSPYRTVGTWYLWRSLDPRPATP